MDSARKFHGICFLRKGPLKGEIIEFVLICKDFEDFEILESNFAPLNAFLLNEKNLKDVLVSISAFLVGDDLNDGLLLKIANGSETILKLT